MTTKTNVKSALALLYLAGKATIEDLNLKLELDSFNNCFYQTLKLPD